MMSTICLASRISNHNVNVFLADSPLSPTNPSYRGKVLPPPKRSSIKRPTKRPNAPPPLPPGLTQEPTYEYLTIAPFDASIPDGISFEEDKKVQVAYNECIFSFLISLQLS